MKRTFFTRMNLFISIITLITSMTTITFAKSYYISTSGNDGNNGSISSPWRSVNNAYRKSGAGDTVFVRGGTYSDGEMWLTGNKGSAVGWIKSK